MIDKIKKLGRLEHIEIFKIIKNDVNYYTENINGIFININILKESTIIKIVNFVDFCNKKKEELIETELLLKEKEEILSQEMNNDTDKILLNIGKDIDTSGSDRIDKKSENTNYVLVSDDENSSDKIILKKKKIKY